MERLRIRRMAERLAVKITRNVPQDRFEQERWDLAAIIEEHPERVGRAAIAF